VDGVQNMKSLEEEVVGAGGYVGVLEEVEGEDVEMIDELEILPEVDELR
jgi:hypothetical protein